MPMRISPPKKEEDAHLFILRAGPGGTVVSAGSYFLNFIPIFIPL